MKGRPKVLAETQKELDVKKYHESIVAGYDTCGTYDYCVFCNKNNKYPCAAAVLRFLKEVK